MAEVPQNMQNDLQRMEVEARGAEQKPLSNASQAGGYGAEESNS